MAIGSNPLSSTRKSAQLGFPIGRSPTIDGRTTRHAGYAVSQRIRKRIEEAFGWIKTIAGQERTKFRGRERVGWAFTYVDRTRGTKLRRQSGSGLGEPLERRAIADGAHQMTASAVFSSAAQLTSRPSPAIRRR